MNIEENPITGRKVLKGMKTLNSDYVSSLNYCDHMAKLSDLPYDLWDNFLEWSVFATAEETAERLREIAKEIERKVSK